MTAKNIIKTAATALSAAGFIICIFVKSEACVQGVREGLKLCALTVIPSLFPFLIVSRFLTASGLSDALGRLFSKPTRFIFGLSGTCAPVILMSLIGGFPVGAKMAAELCDGKRITKSEAQRLCLFCINAGPAFIIGTVGSLMLSSAKAGVILYISCIASSLTVGVLSRFLGFEKVNKQSESRVVFISNPAVALTSSVTDALNTMLLICAWIVIFNAVISVILTSSDGAFAAVLCSVLEVTNGAKLTAKLFSLPVLAAILCFGGISVHCQIMPYILKSGLKLRLFFASRVVCAALSALVCKALLSVFPCETAVFSNYTGITASAYSVSLPSAAALIIMCALLIFEVDTNRKVC